MNRVEERAVYDYNAEDSSDLRCLQAIRCARIRRRHLKPGEPCRCDSKQWEAALGARTTANTLPSKHAAV